MKVFLMVLFVGALLKVSFDKRDSTRRYLGELNKARVEYFENKDHIKSSRENISSFFIHSH